MFCIVNRNLQLSIFTFAMEKSKKINAKLLAVDVAECAIFVALMTAGAFIKIKKQGEQYCYDSEEGTL